MLVASSRGAFPAVLAAFAGWLGLVAAPPAEGSSYSFQVADSAYPNYFGAPSINDYGWIDFTAESPQGGIRAVNGPIGNGSPKVGLSTTFLGRSMTNNLPSHSDSTVYRANSPEIVEADGIVIPVAPFLATTSAEFTRFGDPVINNSAVVAFFAERDDGGSAIYIGSNATGISPIANSTGLFSSFGEVVSINNAGEVALTAASGDFEALIVTADGLNNRYVATNSGEPFARFYTPWINDSGQVAFRAHRDDGQGGIYVGNPDGTFTTVAQTDGPFAAFEYPIINNQGQIAFAALIDAGANYGIFTGPDPIADKVIQEGDPLFGSTITQIGFFRGMNNHGQIAFRYRLASGAQGIAVATPTAVPEASSLLLLALGLAATSLWGRTWSH